MNAKTQTGETQTGEIQTGETQTTKDAEELELTKDYLANRITRSYYTATGFAQFFIRLNQWFDEVTDIYAFFNPEDTYKDKYNQVCAKIIGLLLWKEGDKLMKRNYVLSVALHIHQAFNERSFSIGSSLFEHISFNFFDM